MRTWRSLAVGVALLSVAGCWKTDASMSGTTPAPVSQSFDVRLQDIFAGASGLESPIDLQAPAGDSRLFIAERPGRIRIVKNGTLLAKPFLDISSRVYIQGEAGLLSFAFDPQYPTRAFVYVHFIQKVTGNEGNIAVERFQLSATDPDVLDPSTAAPVISIPHTQFSNHYGGRVAFGPDGMLYLSTGDGGGGGDTLLNGQKAATFLGKLLRLDVSGLPGAIPNDNPVWPGVGQNENWAIGLRNPFRYAFDGSQLFIADVGEGAREEIDVVAAGTPGVNYGWNITEGTLCFAGPCAAPGLTPPVYDYDHGQGCAIIGGYVYRGTAVPGAQGTYFFSDLCTGFLRGLTMQNGVATVVQAPAANAGTPLSFGQDGMGEVYILTAQNRVLKIVRP